MKLNFCRFIRVMKDMGLTRCYKTEVFYIYICSFSTTFYAISITQTCLRSQKSICKPISIKMEIGRSVAESWRHIDFSKWRP